MGRNGNAQGYCWNGTLDDGRRTGKERAELYNRRDRGGDQDTETSTSDGSSGDDRHTYSYEPSESCSYSQPSSSLSLAVTPSLRHEPNEYIGASSQTRSRTYLDYDMPSTERMGGNVSYSPVETPQISQEQSTEKSSKATQVIGSLRYRLS